MASDLEMLLEDQSPKTILDWFFLALGTGLFVGLLFPRFATVAALWGIPIAFGLHAIFGPMQYLAVLCVLWLLGIPICARSARIIGVKDPRQVTYDEFTSLPLVYIFSPAPALHILVIGFLLHRLFDILKPLGVGRLERFGGGLGIMADDVLAAVYALLILQCLVFVGIA